MNHTHLTGRGARLRLCTRSLGQLRLDNLQNLANSDGLSCRSKTQVANTNKSYRTVVSFKSKLQHPERTLITQCEATHLRVLLKRLHAHDALRLKTRNRNVSLADERSK
jgi:hypothetical protein